MESAIKRRDFITAAAAAGTAAGLLLASPAQAKTPAPPKPAAPYNAPSAERDLPDSLLADLEEAAEKTLPATAFAFIAGGSEKAWTLKENPLAFDRIRILPRYLSGKSAPDLRTTLLGSALALPVITTPMGAHGFVHKSAELGTARGTAAAGTLMAVSTAANYSIEEVAAATSGPKWFQLYLAEGDPAASKALLQRAKKAGYSAVVFTIDAFARGGSDKADKAGAAPSLPRPNMGGAGLKKTLGWEDLAFIRDNTDLPIVLKGVLSPDMVDRALKSGVAAIQVSNHGGRQLDGVPASITVLPAIAKAVAGRVPIILDSGIRRGTDVFKALALGADAVALGRPVLYGLGLGGAKGVASVYGRLRRELARDMTIAGVASVKEITAEFVEM